MLGCYVPTITLVPGQSSIGSPLQYRRSQDFSITSMIVFNCSGSLSTITTWKITNCTSICSNQVQTDQTITTTLSELYIPAKTLPYGIYELTLNVTMIDTPNLKSSSSVYIQITQSDITVNFIQLGVSLMTYGYEQDILFDPGTYSIDPDEDQFDASVNISRIKVL